MTTSPNLRALPTAADVVRAVRAARAQLGEPWVEALDRIGRSYGFTDPNDFLDALDGAQFADLQIVVSDRRTADHVDGYDRDDTGESQDY